MKHSVVLRFERVTIYVVKKIAVCQRFSDIPMKFPNISQLGNLSETNSHIPVVSISNPIRCRAFSMTTDWLLAFWDGVSRGTGFTIDYAVKRGVPYKVVSIV